LQMQSMPSFAQPPRTIPRTVYPRVPTEWPSAIRYLGVGCVRSLSSALAKTIKPKLESTDLVSSHVPTAIVLIGVWINYKNLTRVASFAFFDLFLSIPDHLFTSSQPQLSDHVCRSHSHYEVYQMSADDQSSSLPAPVLC